MKKYLLESELEFKMLKGLDFGIANVLTKEYSCMIYLCQVHINVLNASDHSGDCLSLEMFWTSEAPEMRR